jgi:xanthine/uracil permease
VFAHAPDAAKLFLNSGIFLAAATAVLLNLFFSSQRKAVEELNDGES